MTDISDTLKRLASLCARSEQCRHDIHMKLIRTRLSETDRKKILDYLIDNRFVDDARYARAFANDKVRFSAWGRRKIAAALAAKRIARPLIADALDAIEPDDYREAALRAARSKASALDLSEYEDRCRLMRHLLQKGFESDIASSIISTLSKQ